MPAGTCFARSKIPFVQVFSTIPLSFFFFFAPDIKESAIAGWTFSLTDGIPGVTRSFQGFHDFLDRLEMDIKEYGYQPHMKNCVSLRVQLNLAFHITKKGSWGSKLCTIEWLLELSLISSLWNIWRKTLWERLWFWWHDVVFASYSWQGCSFWPMKMKWNQVNNWSMWSNFRALFCYFGSCIDRYLRFSKMKGSKIRNYENCFPTKMGLGTNGEPAIT